MNPLFTQSVHCSPILIMHCKPLTRPWTDVNINRTEVIVLLVAWRSIWWSHDHHKTITPYMKPLHTRCAASRHLHVQLYRVHSQDCVTNIVQKVCLRARDLCEWVEVKGSSPHYQSQWLPEWTLAVSLFLPAANATCMYMIGLLLQLIWVILTHIPDFVWKVHIGTKFKLFLSSAMN